MQLRQHGKPIAAAQVNWAKGPNIDKITFAQLMTHRSGFRVPETSDTFYTIMKQKVADGVTDANLGQPSYQNMNFSLCRILLPVMNGTIPASTVFPRLSRINFGILPLSPPTLTLPLSPPTLTMSRSIFFNPRVFPALRLPTPTRTRLPTPSHPALAGTPATLPPTPAAQAGTCRWMTC